MLAKVGGLIPCQASVHRLKQDTIPVVVKKLFLSFRKRTHVQNSVGRYSHIPSWR